MRRRHRAGRRDRRHGHRHQREDHARGAGERQLPGVLDSQDLGRHQAAHRRLHALRKGAGPGQHGARPGARHRIAAGDLRPASAWWAAWPTRSKAIPAPPAILLPTRLAGAQARPRGGTRPRCARILERLEFGVTEPRAARFLRDRALLARHQGRRHQRRPGGRGGPHGGLRFHHAAARRWFRPPCRPPTPSASSSTRCATFLWTRASPRSTTTRSSAKKPARAFGFDPAAHVRVANPIASDQALMRTSLLPGIWKQHRSRTASTATPSGCLKSASRFTSAPSGLPDEIPHLVAALYDRQGDGSAGLFEIKRAAECLMPGARGTPRRAASVRAPGALRRYPVEGRKPPAASSSCTRRWSNRAARRFSIWTCALVQAAERRRDQVHAHPPLSLERLRSFGGRRPARARRQVARPSVASFAGPLLESIEFVRQYSGPPLEEGTKSVSFRLTVGSPERTLSSEEVGEIRARIIEGSPAQLNSGCRKAGQAKACPTNRLTHWWGML